MSNKSELTEVLEDRLEGKGWEEIAQLISDWMSKTEMEEFLEFVQVESE